jgi:hypothetical protein
MLKQAGDLASIERIAFFALGPDQEGAKIVERKGKH